jgi:hypothetical protein
MKHPEYKPSEKLVIYVFAILPEALQYMGAYFSSLEIVKKAYQNVDDNFIYLDLESVLKDAGIVSSNIF